MRKKTLVELGIIAVMATALVFASMSLVKRPGSARGPFVPKGPVPAGAPGILQPTAKLTAGIKIRRIKDDSFYVKLSRVADVLPLDRDPFSFGGTGPRSSRDGLALTGILREGERPTAIIEDGFYKEGDSTAQFTVVSIQEDKVVLKDSSGQFELRLKS
jgi:hypothetical protein